jgi:hypothetical protein
MVRPTFEVADVIRVHGESLLKLHGAKLSARQHIILRKLAQCRTAALGGHVESCDTCGHQRISYNSCRDRHCPKCLGSASAAWFSARTEDLLPVPYFHVVCTLPHELAPIAQQNPAVVYALLMRSAAESLLQVAKYPHPLGARIGFFGVLHTWGQKLDLHPHVHYVVPAGGISLDGTRWVHCRKNFLVPIRVLRNVFRAKFLDELQQLFEQSKLGFYGSLEHLREPHKFASLVRKLRKKKWIVYSKPPFGGPQQVLKYLARYTHRVAISNHRILALDESGVTFGWKDYAAAADTKSIKLAGAEFLRRLLQHVLPKRFVRIRHYGLLAHRNRDAKVANCRKLIAESVSTTPTPTMSPTEASPNVKEAIELGRRCPACKQGRMIETEVIARASATTMPPRERAPP